MNHLQNKKQTAAMQNKKQTAAMQNRMFNLLHQLNKDMHERDHILAIALLGAIAGQNTFGA